MDAWIWRATVLLVVVALATSLTITDNDGAAVSNSTIVTSLGQRPSFHCRSENGSGTWTDAEGNPVPSSSPARTGAAAATGAGAVVVQVFNGSSTSLVFLLPFSPAHQGVYLCAQSSAQLGEWEAYVSLFTSNEIAPQDVRVSLQAYPKVSVQWSHPSVGAEPVGMYQVVVVVPRSHAPLLLGRTTTEVQIEAITRPEDRYRMIVTVAAVYRFLLEPTRAVRDIIPPPANLSGKPISSPGSVELKWDRVMGVVLAGYDVTFGLEGAESTQRMALGVVGQTVAVVRRLDPGRYHFTVRANPADPTALAFPSPPVFVEPLTEPGSPRDVTVTAPSLTQVTVSWQPPRFTGGVPILRYFLALGPFSVTVASDHALSHTFTQLDPDGAYLLTVQAENAVGRGSSSPHREVFPRQLYQQGRSLPLEVVVPCAVGGLLLVVGAGSVVVCYFAVRKRKNRLRLMKSGDGHMSKQVDLAHSSEDLTRDESQPPPPPPPPPSSQPRNAHTFNSRSRAAVNAPVPLRAAASFNVPRRNVITRLPDSAVTDTMTTNTSYLRASQLHGFSVSTESLDNADYDSIMPVPDLPPPRKSSGQTSRQDLQLASRQEHHHTSRQEHQLASRPEPRLKVRDDFRKPQVPRKDPVMVAAHTHSHSPTRLPAHTSRQEHQQASRQDLYQTSRQDHHNQTLSSRQQTPHSQTSLQESVAMGEHSAEPRPPPLQRGMGGRSLSHGSFDSASSQSSCTSCYEDLDPTTLEPSDPGYTRLHRPKHLYDSLRLPAPGHQHTSALCRSIEDMGTGSTSGSGRGNHTGGSGQGNDAGSDVTATQTPQSHHGNASQGGQEQLPGNQQYQLPGNQLSLSRSEHYSASLAAYSYEKPLPAKKPLLPPAPPSRH